MSNILVLLSWPEQLLLDVESSFLLTSVLLSLDPPEEGAIYKSGPKIYLLYVSAL